MWVEVLSTNIMLSLVVGVDVDVDDRVTPTRRAEVEDGDVIEAAG